MTKQKQSVASTNNQWHFLSSDSPFAVTEAYKALRTNVLFSLPDGGSKCIGVTSATKGEGKSSTALNLAISFAQIGKNTLIIDCDMRLPTIASKLGVSGVPGLSNILVKNENVADALRQIGKLGITVLPSGTIPPDPTYLLESKRMESLLGVLRKYYEVIIVDLPPVNSVTDAAIMARYLDGMLLVVRHNVAEYREVQSTLNQLKLADAKILGLVYNDAPVTGKSYYKHYY